MIFKKVFRMSNNFSFVQYVDCYVQERSYLHSFFSPEVIHDGGSCLAGPNGEFIVAPVTNRHGIVILEDLELNNVRREKVFMGAFQA